MNATKRDQLSVFLLIASILALLLAIMGSVGMALLGIITWFIDNSASAGITLIIAAAFMVMGLCTIPGIVYGYQGMQGKIQVRKDKPLAGWTYIGLLFPIALGLGYLAFNRGVLPSLLGPLAHISAATIPVVFALAILLRKGSPISAKRTWGHFLAGLWASPMVAFIVEILAAIPLIIIVFAMLFQEMNSQGLIENFTRPEQWTEPYLVSQVQEFTNQPLILFLVTAFLIVFVPMVEEAIKTIGVWPVIRRGFTQYQAFIGGAIAGAGYGLFEAFFLGQILGSGDDRSRRSNHDAYDHDGIDEPGDSSRPRKWSLELCASLLLRCCFTSQLVEHICSWSGRDYPCPRRSHSNKSSNPIVSRQRRRRGGNNHAHRCRVSRNLVNPR